MKKKVDNSLQSNLDSLITLIREPDVIIAKLKNIFQSRAFLWFILILFCFQAGVVAITQDPVRNMDERRLMEVVTYYSSLPVLNGPVISDLPSHLAYIGAMERMPSYLYFYVLSFADRIFTDVLDLSNQSSLILLRFATILCGVALLLVLRKIIIDFGRPTWMANLTAFLLSLTSSFVYVSAIVSYDIPSLLIMMCLSWLILQLIQKRQLVYLWYAILLVPLLFLIKYTYVPAAGLMVAGGMLIHFWKSRHIYEEIREDIFNHWRKHKYLLTAYILVLALFSGMILERVTVNVLQYHRFTPTCDQVFSHDDCYNGSSIYKRDYKEKMLKSDNAPINFKPEPVSFTLSWANRMYRTLFFDIDGQFRYPGWAVMCLSWIAFMIVAAAVFFKKRVVGRSLGENFIIWSALLYLVTVFTFNLRSYLITGSANAQHGRYIHFSVAFLLLLAVQLLSNHWVQLGGRVKSIIILPAILYLAVTLVLYLPLVEYFYYTPTEWFYPPFLEIVKHLPFRL